MNQNNVFVKKKTHAKIRFTSKNTEMIKNS